MPFIDVVEAQYSYPGADGGALNGLSLRIERGEYVAIVGANGSGKTTLALHLNGLLVPSAGRVEVAGLDTRLAGSLAPIRHMVALVFQKPEDQVVGISVEEDAAFGPENLGLPRPEIRRRVDEALRRAGLRELRERSPHELSGGQKQRLAIAGALAMEPECLVLDEATAMLDPSGRSSVVELLAELNDAGVTLVHVTHRMELAARASRLVVLDRGRVAADASPREVFEREELPRWGLRPPAAFEISRRLSARLPVSLHLDVGSLGRELVALARSIPAGPIDQASAAAGRAARWRPATGRPIVELETVSHAYGDSRGLRGEIPSLRDVSLAVRGGEAIALIGATGSGKSTLLQHLNALILPARGGLRVDGVPITPDTRDLAPIRRRIGLVFQSPEEQLFEQYVGDEIAYGPRLQGLSGKRLTERVRWAMECVGLPFEPYKDRLTFALSGGEQRKVAIAGVIALRPAVLLLDEPTSGLDPEGAEEILGLLERLRAEGTALVLSTHEMEEAARVADRAVALSEGRVAFDGAARELFGRPEALEDLGLEAPAPARLLAQLRAAGLPLPAVALGAEELESALMDLFAPRAGGGTKRGKNAAV